MTNEQTLLARIEDEVRCADSLRLELSAIQHNRIAGNIELLARAERAELVLAEVVDRFGPWHDDDCPADDTCDCSAKPLHDRINAALRDTA